MKNFFILTLSVFFMSMFNLNASLIVTPGISENDFNTAFSADRVWYAQFQPGGAGTTHPDNESELGGETLRYYEGNTSIVDESNNPFEINVDSANNLSVTLNNIGTPGGFEYGITKKFNTIWIGLESDFFYGPDETLDVINHQINTGDVAILSDMNVGPGDWTAFKFYVDDKLDNIESITISGDLLPDMRHGGSINEDWTYTVFATHDISIVPEPSSVVLLIVGIVSVFAFRRRKIA
jgi:hypothetical protein